MSGWPLLWDRVRRWSERPEFPTIVDILSRTALVSSVRDAARMKAHCDLYLRPDVDRFGMNDFAAIDALVDAGYRAADTGLAQWAASAERSEHV
jgi:predicted acylesterase/phospholipase RssA